MYLPHKSNKEASVFSRTAFRIIISALIIIWIASFTNVIFKGYAGLFYPAAVKSFSLVCHQDPVKTFSLSGVSMLVCARCAGIYSGAAVVSIAAVFGLYFLPRTKLFLYLSAIPLVIDLMLYNSGVYNYSKGAGLATGLILGSVVFIYILAAMKKFLFDNG